MLGYSTLSGVLGYLYVGVVVIVTLCTNFGSKWIYDLPFLVPNRYKRYRAKPLMLFFFFVDFYSNYLNISFTSSCKTL